MLRFNIIFILILKIIILISIHPMLRFNVPAGAALSFEPGFQYILCYGSTAFVSAADIVNLKFQYILCYGSTKSLAFSLAGEI